VGGGQDERKASNSAVGTRDERPALGSAVRAARPATLSQAAGRGGARSTVFVAPLTLGRIRLGSMGFVLPGTFDDGGAQVLALVTTVAEMFDSAVLSFIALSEGQAPLERLDELAAKGEFRPRGRIGRYELLYPLGTGGMAQVMVARTVNPGGVSRLVALKRILPRLAEDESIVAQFHDEAKLGMQLNHPNLVTIYDFGSAGGAFFIAMELIKGVDFDSIVYWQHGPVPAELIAAVLCQALEGLHAAHELKGEDGLPLGLVHRDLSPHNLMVGFDGRVKVLDFGVAKMRDQRTVTLPGIVKGKPLYMSPEQATAERIDRRSDLFAMGLILFEALVGSRAFDRKDDTLTMEAIVNDPLARPPAMPQALWDVVSRATEKHPEHRYRDALEMAEALREAVAPLSERELGELVTARFPRRVRDIETWETTRSQLAKAPKP
jgi:serine/threonine-protein kinase